MTSVVGPGQTYNLHGVLASGSTLIADASTGTYGNPAPALIVVNQAAVNDGIIDLQANTGYGVFGAVGATLDVSGRLANGGLIDVQGGAAGSHYGGGAVRGAQLVNTGVLLNTGTLVVHAAYYAPQEGQPGTAGTLVDAGAMTNTGVMTFTGGSYGAGYGIAPGGQGVVSGILLNTGLIDLQSYQVTYSGHTFYGPGDGATLAVSGTLANTGTIDLAGSIGINGFYHPTTPKLDITGVLTNRGVIDVAPGTSGGSGGTIVDSGTLLNSGTILLQGATDGSGGGGLGVAAGARLIDSGSIAGAGTVYNSGVIVAAGAATTIAAALVNNGTVSTRAGHNLAITGAITADPGQNGQFEIGAHSALTLNATIGAGETIDFGGSGAVLGLSDPGGFGGVLADIAPGVTLDFLATTVSGAAISGDVLRIGVGANTYTFQLAQPLAAGVSYGLSSDGHGGTDLVFAALGAGPPHA